MSEVERIHIEFSDVEPPYIQEAKGKRVIFRNRKGRTCASFELDLRLTKTVSGKTAFRRYPPAITWDNYIIEEARKLGATIMEVIDKDSGIVYRASFEQWDEKSFALTDDTGQRHMSFQDWDDSRTDQKRLEFD
jgi:hypothetical protein